MSLEKRIYSVLLVSASERFNAALTPLLPEGLCDPVVTVSSVSRAGQASARRGFDFILLNSPLPDDAGIRFAIDRCHGGSAVVLLFVKSELFEGVSERASEHGVYVLPKPTPRGELLQALRWMIATRERLRGVEQKVRPLEEKMEEIRLVNRAKWLLIRELKLSEPDAHHYIERQAMDRCISKKEIAEEIIRLYN